MISSLASKCQDFKVEMLFFQPLYSGVFSTGATGAIAPVILRKRLIAPVIFTWEGFKSWTNFTQESYQMI